MNIRRLALIAVSILHYIITVITELEFYPWYFDPSIHGILAPLPMVYRTPFPWYIDPPIHGISIPLSMVN